LRQHTPVLPDRNPALHKVRSDCGSPISPVCFGREAICFKTFLWIAGSQSMRPRKHQRSAMNGRGAMKSPVGKKSRCFNFEFSDPTARLKLPRIAKQLRRTFLLCT
jgi:hypothetical protein